MRWVPTDCGSAAEELAALCSDFPEYDRELLQAMLEDQAGDAMELRAVLRVSAAPPREPFLRQTYYHESEREE